jgi:hypothetical protein
MKRDEARDIFENMSSLTHTYSSTEGLHPIQDIDYRNPKPGRRRWVANPYEQPDDRQWRKAWASVHYDGSVSFAAALGGSRIRGGHANPSTVDSARAERFVTDFLALVKAASDQSTSTEYGLRLGLEWEGAAPLIMEAPDPFGYPPDGQWPFPHFIPIITTVQTDVSNAAYLDQLRDIALDVVNQGSVQDLRTIREPAE